MKTLSLLLTLLFSVHSLATNMPLKINNVTVTDITTKATMTGPRTATLETGNKNLLVNPGFEHSTLLEGWGLGASTGTAVAGLLGVPVNPLFGKNSLEFSCNGMASGGTCTILQDVLTKHAIQGMVSIYLKSDSATGVKLYNRTNYVNGKFVEIKSTASGLYKIPTILNTTSTGILLEIIVAASQTIKVIMDEGFVGAQDLKQDVNNMSDATAYTPTITGFGTVTNISFFYSQVGDKIKVNGSFTTGTPIPTAVEARVSLPSPLLFSSAGVHTNIGRMRRQSAGTAAFMVSANPSSSYVYFGNEENNPATSANGDAIAGGGQIIYVNFESNIQGWSSGNTTYSVENENREIVGKFAKSGTQPLSATNNKITGFSSTKDSVSGWDATNNWYKIKESGDYDLILNLYHIGNIATTVPAYRVNGGTWRYGSEATTNRANSSFLATGLVTGDYVEVGVYLNTTSTLQVADTNFSIAKRFTPSLITGSFNGIEEIVKGERANVAMTTGSLKPVSFGFYLSGNGTWNTSCTASPCNVNQVGTYISSITRNGAGSYTVNFSKTFNKVFCTSEVHAHGAFWMLHTNNVIACLTSCSTEGFEAKNTSGVNADIAGAFVCKGELQ